MRPELVALYGGPDQIMGLASGLAAGVAFLLMCWNKILVTFGKITNWVRPSDHSQDPSQDA